MREPWIRQHFGPETSARRGFEDELADDLSAAWHGAASAARDADTAGRDDLWAGTRPDPPAGSSPAAPHRPVPREPAHHEPVPLQRRPASARPQPAGGRRGVLVGAALVAAAVVVAIVVVRQQSDDSTTPGSPGVTSGATLPGGATVPGQTIAPGDSTGTGTDAGGTTVDEGTAAGTQFMSPACFETRPTTAIPAAIDPAVLETATDVSDTPTLRISLPTPVEGASFNTGSTDVRVVPGGVLVKASLLLADGSTSDTMLSVVNNDGVVRWTRCFTNAYTIGPFGENGDGSITIWVARNTTDLARYVDLATGDTSDLFTGYTGSTGTDGSPPGLAWTISGSTVSIWLPAAAAVGNHELSLP